MLFTIPVIIAVIMVVMAGGFMRMSKGTDQLLVFMAMVYCLFAGVFLGMAAAQLVKQPQRQMKISVAVAIVTSAAVVLLVLAMRG